MLRRLTHARPVLADALSDGCENMLTTKRRTRRARGMGAVVSGAVGLSVLLGSSAIAVLGGGQGARAAASSAASLTKTGTDATTGSAADSATGSRGKSAPGDTISWVLHYANKTGSSAQADITDKLNGQTYVPGSLVAPPGLAPKWSTDGGTTYRATEPAAGVDAIGAAGQIGAPGIISEFPQSVPPFRGGNGGDGYEVLFYGDNVYNVHHHINSIAGTLLECHNKFTGVVCPGFDPAGVNVPITAGGAFARAGDPNVIIQTPQSSSGVLDPKTGRIYSPVNVFTNGAWQYGVLCSDVATQTSCGFFPQGSAPSGLFVTGGTSVGTKIYYTDSAAVTHCFDYATTTTCGAITAPGFTSTDVTNGQHSRTEAFGTYVFTSFVRKEQNNARYLLCVDSTTNTACPGFPKPVTANNLNAVMNATMAPVLDTSGKLIGVCNTTNQNGAATWSCFDVAGNSITNPYPASLTGGGTVGAFQMGDGVTIGTKVYLPVEAPTKYVCFDFKTNASCAGFSSNPPQDIAVYTLRQDPNVPACIWAYGDDGVFETFNANTGGSCQDANAMVTTVPAQNYCDGKTGHVRGWTTLAIDGVNSTQYASAIVTILDIKGNPVPGFDHVRVSNAQRSVDISSIPVTGDTSALTADVTLVGLDPGLKPSPTVSINFDGDPVQICFKTKVPTTCPGTTTVSNTAHEVTTGANGLTDAPAGVSSGTAEFTVDYSALCQPDLSVTKTTPAREVLPGDVFSYTVTVKNATANSTTAPTVTDTLPPFLSFVSASDRGTAVGKVVTWTDVDVPGSGSTSLTVKVRVDDKTPYSTHFHNVVTAPIPGDPTPNNSGTNDDPYTPNPALTIKKDVCVSGVPADCDVNNDADWVAHTTLPPSSTATYRITVTNTGDTDLANVAVTDTHPEGNKTVPTLPIKGVHRYTYQLPAAAEDSNTADATGVPEGCTGVCLPVTSPPKTAGYGSAAYTVTKEVCVSGDPAQCRPAVAADWTDKAHLALGAQATYRITVVNTGKVDLANIKVTDKHPEGTHTIASLPAGGKHAYIYTIDVVANGDTNTVTTTAEVPGCTSCTKVPPTDEHPTASYDTASFTITKEVCTSGTTADCDTAVESMWVAQATLPVGSKATYRIRLVNTGKVDLDDVMVEDTHKEGSRTIAVLKAGETVTYTYNLVVADGGQTNVVVADGLITGQPDELVPGTVPPGGHDSTEVLTPAYTLIKQVCLHNPAGPCDVKTDANWASMAQAQAGKTVTFRIIVKNTGLVPVGPIVVTDLYPEGNKTVDEIDVAKSFSYTYTVTAKEGTHTNTVSATAEVPGCTSCKALTPVGGIRTATYTAPSKKPPVAVLPIKVGPNAPSGPSGILAHTGATTFVLLGIAVGLLGVGAAFLLGGSRRARRSSRG